MTAPGLLRLAGTLPVLVAIAAGAATAGTDADVPLAKHRDRCVEHRPAPAGPNDVDIGPLRIGIARSTVRNRLNSFGGRGWKLPITVLNGSRVTLSVPERLRGRVGLAYRLRVRRRVERQGVRAADPALRFVACPGEGRTAYGGGFLVDRRRCARLRVTVEGQPEPIVRRVPLGRRCR